MKIFIFMALLMFCNVNSISCNRALEIYEEIRKSLSVQCQKSDREDSKASSKSDCPATADLSLLCLPSGNVGEVHTIYCKIYNPLTNETVLDEQMTRKCTPTGQWKGSGNKCMLKSMEILNSEFFRRGIDPFTDFDPFDFDELTSKLSNNKVYNSTPPPREKYLENRIAFTEKDLVRMELMTLILDIFSCFFSILGLIILIWLYPRKKHDRINIHRHLFSMLTFMYIFDILFFNYGAKRKMASLAACHTTYFLYAFFDVSVHTWMFNEGLYHFWIIFFPYKNEMKFRYFIIIGYGIATLLMAIHVPGVLIAEGKYYLCEEFSDGSFSMITIWDKVLWYSSSAILYLNLFIFVYLMIVLRRKLQREQTSNLKKNWRLLKSWVILLILLGGGNFFALETTIEKKYIGFAFFQRAVYGLQGFLIFASQVVFSSDVRKKVQNKWRIYTQKKEVGTPMSVRNLNTSTMKLSLTKLNSVSSLTNLTHIGSSKKSYVVNSVKRKQSYEDQKSTGLYIENSENTPKFPRQQKLKDQGENNLTSKPQNENENAATKEVVCKQESIGFDNIGFNKDESGMK